MFFKSGKKKSYETYEKNYLKTDSAPQKEEFKNQEQARFDAHS